MIVNKGEWMFQWWSKCLRKYPTAIKVIFEEHLMLLCGNSHVIVNEKIRTQHCSLWQFSNFENMHHMKSLERYMRNLIPMVIGGDLFIFIFLDFYISVEIYLYIFIVY
jgi:hypothetical protein